MANFELIDCDGNNVEFADFFCERGDIGVHNRAVLLNIGAGWCEPCRIETREDLPPAYAALHDQGLEIVQVMFQDWDAASPTRMFCTDWKEGNWREGDIGQQLAFPILVDQVNDWRQIYLSAPDSQTPTNLLLDANGNIRWKEAGERPNALEDIIGVVMDTPYGP
ncbi:MAG: redoxin family protein [bacterium]|nr:redoxin family protein [bacterium]